jgi:16S rRNA processing protein RimM
MKFVTVGQVAAAHGLRGEVRFRYYNEGGDAPLRYPSFFVDHNGAKIELRPAGVRALKGQFIIKFEGLESVDQVRFLLGKEVFVGEDDLAPLGVDEYYDYQLIGLEAVTEDGRSLGAVKDVMHTRANDILVVGNAPEVLVPMTEDHIVKIDTEAGLVRVRGGGIE